MRLPRFQLRTLMLAVATVAVPLSCVHSLLRRPWLDRQADYHAMMAEFCDDEAVLMVRRAIACRLRESRGAPWEDASEEAEDLKSCPYPWDGPRYTSWGEQAAVWDRAAAKSREAAEWHRSMASWYQRPL